MDCSHIVWVLKCVFENLHGHTQLLAHAFRGLILEYLLYVVCEKDCSMTITNVVEIDKYFIFHISYKLHHI